MAARMTVQRPEQFDTVVDFMPQVRHCRRHPRHARDRIEASAARIRSGAFVTGLLALGLGGYFIGQNGFRFWQGVGPLAAGLILLGGVFLIMAVTISGNEQKAEIKAAKARIARQFKGVGKVNYSVIGLD